VRKAWLQLALIGVAVGVILTLVAVLLQWLPTSASEQFDRIQDIYWFATAISIAIFSLVAAVVIYSVWKWRVPLDDDRDGPPVHGNTTLEIVWTAVPAVLVIVLGVISAIVLSENGKATNNPLHVNVIGQQFAWKFQYPDYENKTSGELVLPVDQQAQFTMSSVDVIHSFWVPQFGQKMDAVPGIETKILVTPTRTGEFAVVCTELCGLGHATMRAKARVVSRTEFDSWAKGSES
jgi:cytochrome c oxidase subunit 2